MNRRTRRNQYTPLQFGWAGDIARRLVIWYGRHVEHYKQNIWYPHGMYIDHDISRVRSIIIGIVVRLMKTGMPQGQCSWDILMRGRYQIALLRANIQDENYFNQCFTVILYMVHLRYTHPCAKFISSINIIWPSDSKWRHWSGLVLAQARTCCLTAPSHYLKQYWTEERSSVICLRAISQQIPQPSMKIAWKSFIQNYT